MPLWENSLLAVKWQSYDRLVEVILWMCVYVAQQQQQIIDFLNPFAILKVFEFPDFHDGFI